MLSILQEQEVSGVHTIVNLQGKPDCKYVVSFQFGISPRRAKAADSWPKNMEENLERLSDAGFIRDRMVPKCRNCNGEIDRHRLVWDIGTDSCYRNWP